MKRLINTKFICCIMACAIITCSLPVKVFATSGDDVPSGVSIEVLEEIEQLNDEIIELRQLLADVPEDNYSKISEINEQIIEKTKQKRILGAEEVDDELLAHFLRIAQAAIAEEEGIISTYTARVPSEVIDQFRGMYDVEGVLVSYGGYSQYHLIFTQEGNDPYLHKVVTKDVYDAFAAGSQTARDFIEDIIEFGASIIVDTIIEEINPFLSYIPWELVSSVIPEEEALYSSGNALLVTLNTTATQKFVYVYSAVNDEWTYCLSTNKVSVACSATHAVSYNGHSYNLYEDFGRYEIAGRWASACNDANLAFNDYRIVKNCVSEVNVYSKKMKKDVITISIHTPTYIIHMMY